MSNQVSSDQLTPNFSCLVIEMKEKIFLLLSADDLQNCREVCEEWNSFILDNLWNHPIIVERRLSRNWSMEDPQYVKTQELIKVDEIKPFVLAATEDYVVVQNIANRDVSLHLSVYKLKTMDVWRTENFVPIGHTYDNLKVHINNEILAVCYKSKGSPGQYTVKVWSTSSHEVIMEENILGLCDSLLETSNSMLILLQSSQVEVLTFNTESLISRHVCENTVPLRRQNPSMAINSKISFPYVLYWQPSEETPDTRITQQMFVWKLDVENNKVEKHLYFSHFKSFAGRGSGKYFEVEDALYVSSSFIVMNKELVYIPDGYDGFDKHWETMIRVVNQDGEELRALVIDELGRHPIVEHSTSACRLLFNGNRLILTMTRPDIPVLGRV